MRACVDSKGVYAPGWKEGAFVEFSDEPKDAFINRARASEKEPTAATAAPGARTLAIKTAPHGPRSRDWRDVVDNCDQGDFADFPVTDPRSTNLYFDFLRRCRNPLDHHIISHITYLRPEARTVGHY